MCSATSQTPTLVRLGVSTKGLSRSGPRWRIESHSLRSARPSTALTCWSMIGVSNSGGSPLPQGSPVLFELPRRPCTRPLMMLGSGKLKPARLSASSIHRQRGKDQRQCRGGEDCEVAVHIDSASRTVFTRGMFEVWSEAGLVKGHCCGLGTGAGSLRYVGRGTSHLAYYRY